MNEDSEEAYNELNDISLFYRACRDGDITTVQKFLEHSTLDLNESYYNDENDGSCFHLACKYNRLSIVELLLTYPKIDVNKINSEHQTGFFISCDYCVIRIRSETCDLQNRIDLFKLLIGSDRIDIMIPDSEEYTPFHMACHRGYVEIVKIFLEDPRMDESSLNSVTIDGKTPFYLACYKNCIEIINLLIEDERINVNKPNKNNRTPFHNACINGYSFVVKFLLNEPRIKIVDDAILYDVCRCIDGDGSHDIETIRLLLDDDRIDPNKTKLNGYTAFQMICGNHNIDTNIIKFFLENDKVKHNQPNDYGLTAFIVACCHSSVETVDLLMKDDRIDTSIIDKSGSTAFYYACQFGNKNVIEYMLANCDDIVLPEETDIKIHEEVQQLLSKYR